MTVEGDAGRSDARELTGEEAALYDRQIRLWGLDAQRRLAGASVLIAGATASLLAQELAKNLVLAGIARLMLTAPEDSRSASGGFLGRDVNACVASLADINPLVSVSVLDPAPDPASVAQTRCTVVCAVDCSESLERQYAIAARGSGIPFYCGRALGPVGFFFVDLGSMYSYTLPEVDAPAEAKRKALEAANCDEAEASAPREAVEKYASYVDAVHGKWGREPPRSDCGWHVACCIRAFEAQEGRLPGSDPDADPGKMQVIYASLQKKRAPARINTDLVEHVSRTACYTLPPVAAITGGMWGREVIKVLSRSDQPLNNFFFFSAKSSQGCVERVGSAVAVDDPKAPLVASAPSTS
jgi:ubiquitin-like 1-activating enzyme E1 A